MCVSYIKTKSKCVGTTRYDCAGEHLEYPAFPLFPALCSLLSPQHHLCLSSAGDHGDEALQHQRGSGAHVPWSGTRLVQRYILCPRIPDAGSLQHHDSEGQCFPLSLLWLHPWDLPRQREREGAKRKMLLRVDLVELQGPPDQLAITDGKRITPLPLPFSVSCR